MALKDGWAGVVGEATHWFHTVHLDPRSSAIHTPNAFHRHGIFHTNPWFTPLSLGPREL